MHVTSSNMCKRSDALRNFCCKHGDDITSRSKRQMTERRITDRIVR
jgi:hypothetical protein